MTETHNGYPFPLYEAAFFNADLIGQIGLGVQALLIVLFLAWLIREAYRRPYEYRYFIWGASISFLVAFWVLVIRWLIRHFHG